MDLTHGLSFADPGSVLCSLLLKPHCWWEWSCNQGNLSTLGTVDLIPSDERIWRDRWWGKLELPGNLTPSTICSLSLMRPSDNDHWQHLPVLPLPPEHALFGRYHGASPGPQPSESQCSPGHQWPFFSTDDQSEWSIIVLSHEIWEFHGWTEKSPVS